MPIRMFLGLGLECIWRLVTYLRSLYNCVGDLYCAICHLVVCLCHHINWRLCKIWELYRFWYLLYRNCTEYNDTILYYNARAESLYRLYRLYRVISVSIFRAPVRARHESTRYRKEVGPLTTSLKPPKKDGGTPLANTPFMCYNATINQTSRRNHAQFRPYPPKNPPTGPRTLRNTRSSFEDLRGACRRSCFLQCESSQGAYASIRGPRSSSCGTRKHRGRLTHSLFSSTDSAPQKRSQNRLDFLPRNQSSKRSENGPKSVIFTNWVMMAINIIAFHPVSPELLAKEFP